MRTKTVFSSVFPSLAIVSSLHGKSSSTGNLLEREDAAASVPEYAVHSHMAAQSAASLHGRQPRPYSMVAPGFSQVGPPQSRQAASTHRFHASHTFGAIRACLAPEVSACALRKSDL